MQACLPFHEHRGKREWGAHAMVQSKWRSPPQEGGYLKKSFGTSRAEELKVSVLIPISQKKHGFEKRLQLKTLLVQ